MPSTVTASLAALLTLTGCAGPLHSKLGAYTARTGSRVRFAGRDLRVTYVTPGTPRSREVLILFATGDAGYWGVSGQIAEHLAAQRYFLVTYDARQLVAREEIGHTCQDPGSRGLVRRCWWMPDGRWGSPDSVPVIVTGYSRGTNMVVLAAGIERLRHHLAGAIAIDSDPPRRLPRAGRHPPIRCRRCWSTSKAGSKRTRRSRPPDRSFALIQGTEDSHIGAEERISCSVQTRIAVVSTK